MHKYSLSIYYIRYMFHYWFAIHIIIPERYTYTPHLGELLSVLGIIQRYGLLNIDALIEYYHRNCADNNNPLPLPKAYSLIHTAEYIIKKPRPLEIQFTKKSKTKRLDSISEEISSASKIGWLHPKKIGFRKEALEHEFLLCIPVSDSGASLAASAHCVSLTAAASNAPRKGARSWNFASVARRDFGGVAPCISIHRRVNPSNLTRGAFVYRL